MNTSTRLNTTPGPWVVWAHTRHPQFFHLIHKDKIIALFRKDDPKAYANAAAISALPQLVDVLIHVQGKLEELAGEIDGTHADPGYVLAVTSEMSEIVAEVFEKIAAESDGLIGG